MLVGVTHAMAQSGIYAAAIDGTKPFASEATIEVGQQMTFDVYLENAPGQATSGGVWVDFRTSSAFISYVSAEMALTSGSSVTGPWDPASGGMANEPDGVGTIMIVVGQIGGGGASPDGDGDIIVARVTLECTAPGDANIRLWTIPGFGTWGPPGNGYDDIAINAATPNPTLVVHQGCAVDADCDDGDYCNGVETCDVDLTDICISGTPIDCDDGVGCTDDSCDEVNDVCLNNPNNALCPDDGVFCNGDEYCDTINNCSSYGDPCPAVTVCNETTDSCDIDTDEDGITDSQDNCPTDFNPSQNNNDTDEFGDVCDNCPSVSNPS
jgi:hypothetical protein